MSAQIYFADASRKEDIERLRMQEYATASGFTLDLNTLKWRTSDDESYILVAEKKGLLVSTMRGEVINSFALLEKKLECPWNFPVPLEGSVLLLSRAATVSSERSSGLNLVLRYWFLNLALQHRIRFVVGTFVKGSPREKSMRKMGYEMFENSLGWQQSSYRSAGPVVVAVLDMHKNSNQALAYCCQQLGQTLSEYSFNKSYPDLKFVGDL